MGRWADGPARHQRPEADIFALCGIDRQAGCMVVVQPDQQRAAVPPLADRAGLADSFAGVLRVRG